MSIIVCLHSKISKQFYFKQFILVYKKVIFQTILFSISTQFSSIWPIDWTLSDATIPDLSGPGGNGNKGVLRIPQSFSITGSSPSNYLVSYPGRSWEVLVLCRDVVSVFSSLSRLGQWYNGYRRRKWTQWLEVISWTKLFAFHKALTPLGKLSIQLFYIEQWESYSVVCDL